MSTFVSEMLQSAEPTLERMAVTFQKIKQAQNAERSRFLKDVDEAQAAIEPVVMQTLGQFDLFLEKIESVVEGKGGPRERGDSLPSTAAESPSTNRGDTPTKGKGSKSSGGKALRPVTSKRVLKKIVG